MQLFYQPLLSNGIHYLDEEESRHCIRVLRHQVGDIIQVVDGQGGWHEAVITDANSKKCGFSVKNTQQAPKTPHYIHIAIAPTKNNDRLEWFVEKAVEIGIDEISFMLCAQSERKIFKTHRVVRKAVSAMKQSLKATLPKINEPRPFGDIIDSVPTDSEKYIAYVDSKNPIKLIHAAQPKQAYCVLIGPEGDFSTDELQLSLEKGFRKASLGQSRLRTETAGVAACHILNLINE